MSRFTRLFFFLIIPAVLLSGVAMAAADAPPRPIASRNPIGESLFATADTYVYEGEPTLNYGSADLISVGSDGGDYLAYIRFDLSPIPANAIVVASDLSLYQSPVLGDPVSVSIERADEVWDETALTWTTRPASTDFGIPAQLLDTNAIGFETWDVTGIVQGWHNQGDPNYGFLVRGAGTNIIQFETREGDVVAPRLNVWFEYPTPTPSSTTPAPTPTDTPEPTSTAGLCPGTIEIPAHKDTYVDFSQPDLNFGSDGLALLGHGNGRKDTLVEFSLADLGPGDYVLDARLEMSRLLSFGTGLLEAYLGPILEPWAEHTVTANTLPAWDTNGIPEYITHTEFTHTWDVTEIVRNWHQGTFPNHGLRLAAYRDPLILAAYATREIGAPAKLVIECGSLPPTATPTPTNTPVPTDTPPPPPPIDYVAEAVEITQAIQNLYNHAVLVEGKPTFVRFYAGAYQDGSPVEVDRIFNASISATRNGVPLAPGKIYNTVRRPWTLETGWSRADSTDAFVFMVPSEWTSGVIELTVEVEPLFGEAQGDEANNTIVTTVGFEDVPPICMVYVPVRTLDLGYPPKDFMIRWSEGREIAARAESLLPTDRLWPFYRSEPLEKWDWENAEYTGYDPDEDNALINRSLWWVDQFSDDPDACDNEPNTETIYAGMAVPAPGKAEVGAGTIGFDQMWFMTIFEADWDEDGDIDKNDWDFPDVAGFGINDPFGGVLLAHELAHNFWAEHVSCNGESTPIDDSYPYPNCQFGETNVNDRAREYFGFDSITRSAFASYFRIPPASGLGIGDLMTYADVVWPSAYTWENLRSEINDAPQAAKVDLNSRKSTALAAGAEFLLLAGNLYPDNNQVSDLKSTVLPTGTLSSATEQELLYGSIDPASPYSVSLLDAQGQLLFEQPFAAFDLETYPNPVLSSRSPDDHSLFFGLAVPYHPDTAEVRITSDGKPVESIAPSTNPPQVTLLSPDSGGVVGDVLDVTWTGTDPDGDRVLYTIQYSPDNGASWLTLAAERGDQSLTVDTTILPGTSGAGLVRVIADDGFHTAMDQSDKPFSLDPHAPQITFHHADGSTFQELEPVHLEATVLDAEDTFLEGDALQWSHDVLGDLGTGSYLMLTDLPTGEYTLELTATDSDGMTAAAEITILIEPAAPQACTLSGPEAPVETGGIVELTGGFYALDLEDTFTASIDWGDGTITPISPEVENGASTITGAHSYVQAGVYTPLLTVTDQDGVSCEAVYEWIVVYTQREGKVTGGGWIDSPPGAYLPDPGLAGKANFGLVAMFKKNSSTPHGGLVFHLPGVYFRSEQIGWLIHPDEDTAVLGGFGTINGEGEYRFILQVGDGRPDTFHLRIWERTAEGDILIYENPADQPLGDGNIIVR